MAMNGKAGSVEEADADCDRDEDVEYDFTHPERGVAIIINNTSFEEYTYQPYRSGAAKDSDNLEETFALLGFQVKSFCNLTTTEMLSVLQKEARDNHTQRDCFVCAISSHGNEDLVKKSRWSSKTEIADVIYGTDGILHLRLITEMFKENNCPTLANKPKLFFIQACRGEELAETVEVADGMSQDYTDWGGYQVITKEIPIYKDYLLAYSAPPGFYSFRRGLGSWFVTALCNVLQTCHKDKDLMTMLLNINHKVATEFQANTPRDRRTHKRHIIPWIASMLTRDLYFRPKTAEGRRLEFV